MSSSPESKFRVGRLWLLAVAAGALLAFPSGAGAATVVNGDFEAGSLAGWTRAPGGDPESGWFAYSGTKAPISTEELSEDRRAVPAPPQGTYGAISDEPDPGTHILYQDIALEPGTTHVLSMLVYYKSEAPIAAPDSLDAGSGMEIEPPPNQQYRIDVMRTSAAIDSVSPGDILTSVFRTVNGAPQELAATPVSVDLTPFAGQTVRLRLAEVDNQFFFNAGADAISIASTPLNAFTLGKLKLNKRKGTGQLKVSLPGPGTVTAVDSITSASKSASPSKKRKKRQALIKNAAATVTAPGVATLNIKPTGAGRKTLRKKGKLAFKLNVTFTPTGGTAATQQFKGKLKLTRKKKPGRR